MNRYYVPAGDVLPHRQASCTLNLQETAILTAPEDVSLPPTVDRSKTVNGILRPCEDLAGKDLLIAPANRNVDLCVWPATPTIKIVDGNLSAFRRTISDRSSYKRAC